MRKSQEYDRLVRVSGRRAHNGSRSFGPCRLSFVVALFVLFALIAVPLKPAFSQVPPPPRSTPESTAQPKLVVEQRIKNLGELVEGDKPEISWLIENRGNGDLVIEEVKAGCGCTVVELSEDDRTLPPGSMLDLTAVFDSKGRRGDQNKHVIVYSNDPSEDAMRLEFTATVLPLYDASPSGALNLRMMQRGQWGTRTLELVPAQGRRKLDVVDLTIRDESVLETEVEPIDNGMGRVVRFKVSPSAALGRIDTTVTLNLRVDGIEREREVSIRGEVVADLVWQPKVVDATRAPSVRGRQLPPVTVRAVESAPFEVRGVDAGPWLDVSYEPLAGKTGTAYRFQPVIRADAPDGPFAAELRIETTSLDQPILTIPVFGQVSPHVLVDPPLIVLRKDGTPAGLRRRVKFQAAPQDSLELLDARMSTDVVVAGLDYEASSMYRHIRFIEVSIVGDPAPGTYEETLTVMTNLESVASIEVPIRIEVP